MAESFIPLPREFPPGEGASWGMTPHLWGHSWVSLIGQTGGEATSRGGMAPFPSRAPTATVPVWHPQPGTSFATSSFASTPRRVGALEDKHSLKDTMSQGWPLSELAWGFLLNQMSNFP